MTRVAVLITVLFGVIGCGDDDTEADRLGVGAECESTDQCNQEEVAQECLTEFKGGYCGLVGCDSNDDCPEASVCVAHEDSNNYCFRRCIDKVECNDNRSLENEANCVSSADFVEEGTTGKVCVPPSSGT